MGAVAKVVAMNKTLSPLLNVDQSSTSTLTKRTPDTIPVAVRVSLNEQDADDGEEESFSNSFAQQYL